MAHHCLSIPEVLRLAFGGLAKKKDLLAVALTCRAFLEPALDNIWREITLFDPLLACLPQDLWEYREETFELPVQMTIKVAVSHTNFVFASCIEDHCGHGFIVSAT